MRAPREPSSASGLVDLLVEPRRAADLRIHSSAWPSWTLTGRQLSDLELLITGALSPLRGFMTRSEYESVCASTRLPDGQLWPTPLVLSVTPEAVREIGSNRTVALRHPEGRLLAILHLEDIWTRDYDIYREMVDRRAVESDSSVDGREHAHPICLGGRVEALEVPVHYDYVELRLHPAQVRAHFVHDGWTRVMAFFTNRAMHRADVELTRRELRDRGARLLVLAVADTGMAGAVGRYTLVRCLQTALAAYPPDTARLVLLPLANRMRGPRDAVRQALIARNFGCSDVLIERSDEETDERRHFNIRMSAADPGSASIKDSLPIEESLPSHEPRIRIIPARRMVYVAAEDRYRGEDEVPAGTSAVSLSGTEVQERLTAGEPLPDWFSFPAVVAELSRAHPPRSRQGFTVFLTGLSGAGKSTIANVLLVRLLELGRMPVSLLDGDIVRRHLTSELGFSRDHRDLNIQRIAFVAAEVTRCGGVALCAAIAPYNAARRRARRMIEAAGGFVLVHVATPLDVCEQRDAKGLYAKARAGAVTHFTGISDPYEIPADADIVVDATQTSAHEAARQIVSKLAGLGYVNARTSPGAIDAV